MIIAWIVKLNPRPIGVFLSEGLSIAHPLISETTEPQAAFENTEKLLRKNKFLLPRCQQ